MKGYETTIKIRHAQGATKSYIKDFVSDGTEDMLATNIEVKQKKIEITDKEYKAHFD